MPSASRVTKTPKAVRIHTHWRRKWQLDERVLSFTFHLLYIGFGERSPRCSIYFTGLQSTAEAGRMNGLAALASAFAEDRLRQSDACEIRNDTKKLT